jgi:FkbM family methyltransferase
MPTAPTTMELDRNLIYDIGAHKGEDTNFYLKKGFRVVAVEANPTLITFLRQRFSREIAAGTLTLVDCAIAKAEGEVTFFVNESRSMWGTINSDWAERNRKLGSHSHRIQVTAKTFESILRQHGVPYYLKIDIEGADMDCVDALRRCNARPNYVSIESNKTSWNGLLREFYLLRTLGYKKFKIIDQSTVTTQAAPMPAIEGKSTDHVFEYGSSGLFGNDLPGKWLTYEAAIARYRRIFWWYKYFG